ncbi:hypothetical protein KPH14_003932 [Odynerus spinipes]|uniref:Carboxylic ester hydrolase n=1 Tax=Odynerus spinipes TaxID=1348599 RepID=A0AAD9RXX5_9HYME|nr:hypothetical protein KPH14_003932 [Odynerus spinipes]
MTVITTVKQGKLEGGVCQSVLGVSYICFKGIPFAAPPLGKLRFQDPEPPAPWTGVRDAWSIKVNCALQKDEYPPFEIIGDEDCLYLNVYTPALSGLRPVMVYIHGGGFLSGSGVDTFVKPDYLITKDVVLVTINYRLGFLGFLNLNDEVAPGNQGLKDQVAALKWIQENISNFGGDANNVTILGPSAGAASVHYLTLSPMAKGLFHKAICQSGASKCPWAWSESQAGYSFKLAAILGKDSRDPNEIVEFLRTVPASLITQAQSKVLTPNQTALMCLPVRPTTDSKSSNPFLPSNFEELSNDQNIPMMMGYDNMEFIMFFTDPSDEGLKKIENLLQQHVERYATTNDPDKIAQLMRDVRKHFFGDKPITKEDIPAMIKLLSDIYMICPVNDVVDDRRKRNTAPTYLYQFSYVGDEVTLTDILLKHLINFDNYKYFPKGASHVDELSYLFYIPRCKVDNPLPPAVGTTDRIMIERLTRLWTNFAKTGNPTPSLDEYITSYWKPVTQNEFTYYEIDKDLGNLPVKNDLSEIYRRNS